VITFWVKVGIVVFVIAAFFGFKKNYDDGIRDEVRRNEVAPLQAAWDKDKSDRNHAFTKVMVDYVTASQEAEQAKKERDNALHEAELARHARVAAIPRNVADVRVPVVASVLNAGSAGIERSTPATAAGTSEPKHDAAASARPAVSTSDETTVGLWAEWSATMQDLYSSCRDQVTGLLDFYNGLRAKQAKELQP
jgi:hypothetical protein